MMCSLTAEQKVANLLVVGSTPAASSFLGSPISPSADGDSGGLNPPHRGINDV